MKCADENNTIVDEESSGMEVDECRPAKRKRSLSERYTRYPKEVGQPFTGFSFREEGEEEFTYHTSDSDGYFTHNGNKYYRLIWGKNKELEFKFIRTLTDEEVNTLGYLDGDLSVKNFIG